MVLEANKGTAKSLHCSGKPLLSMQRAGLGVAHTLHVWSPNLRGLPIGCCEWRVSRPHPVRVPAFCVHLFFSFKKKLFIHSSFIFREREKEREREEGKH